VNLIGDHTDYNGGIALPMAIDLGIEVTFTPDRRQQVLFRSSSEPQAAAVDVGTAFDPGRFQKIEPAWARFVAAVISLVRPVYGGTGAVTATLPMASGLSSSAALEVAVALALGLRDNPLAVAELCQRAEQAATGVQTGILDQLAVCAGVEGAALLVDCTDRTVEPVVLPEGLEVVVVHSGEHRTLAATAYRTRREECAIAAAHLGPLGAIDPKAVFTLVDPTVRRRARHVVTECDRVRWCVEALRTGDLLEAGRLLTASHASLATDFEVSTPALDALVEQLTARPGVYGARMTGAGFGGCVVTLSAPGALDPASFPTPAWRVRAAAGATVSPLE
jgi:galactokinase